MWFCEVEELVKHGQVLEEECTQTHQASLQDAEKNKTILRDFFPLTATVKQNH